MGFEIKLIYCDKNDNGYDRDHPKEVIKKLGGFSDDISLDKLAVTIMMQMARRDVLVVDAEIFEYKKTKISFKETKGGIIIKNKKFLFDGSSESLPCQDIQEAPQITPPVAQNVVAPHNNLPVHNQQLGVSKRPIKFVVLDDGGAVQDVNGDRVPVMMAIKRAGLQFRAGQRYAVYQEMDDPRDKRVDKFGNPALDRKKVYLMGDDNKREVMVSQDYFVPADVKLERSLDSDPWDKTLGGKAPKLMFEQEMNESMPDLRRK